MGKYKHCGNLEKRVNHKFQVICSECESVCVCMRPANAFLNDWTVWELTLSIVLVNQSIHALFNQYHYHKSIHMSLRVTESCLWSEPHRWKAKDHVIMFKLCTVQLHNSSNLR